MPESEGPTVLTIDVGTSSTRAVLYNAAAQVVTGSISNRANQSITSADGGAVFDADDLFQGVVEAIDGALHPLRDHAMGAFHEQVLRSVGAHTEQIGPTTIGAVAMDTLVGNVLGVDERGRAVTPVFTYADTRNAKDAQILRAELGAEGAAQAHDRTGCLIHSSYLPARFRWLAREHAEWCEAAVRWVSIGEYILYQLLGQWRVSYSVASWSGLLNRRALTWDAEWMEMLPMDEGQLSPLGDLDEPLRGLRPEWAERWPALRSAAWLPAIGDGAAANIGSGCDSPERIALTIGSTGAMRVVVDPVVDRVPDGLWLYRVTAQRGLLGGATTEGGNLFGWLRETLALPPAEELEKALVGRAPATHGLTVLPFVAGERAPGWREDARAVFAGISLHTTSEDIVQAGLEAIAYRFALIYGRIAPHMGDVDNQQIIASGGGLLSSPAWLQMMADVLGQPLLTLKEGEATSRGIALLALEQLGVIARPSELPPETGETYLPDSQRHAIHVEARARQVELYRRVLGDASAG